MNSVEVKLFVSRYKNKVDRTELPRRRKEITVGAILAQQTGVQGKK